MASLVVDLDIPCRPISARGAGHKIEGDPFRVQTYQRDRRDTPPAQVRDQVVPVRAVEAVKPRRHYGFTPRSTGVHRRVRNLGRTD